MKALGLGLLALLLLIPLGGYYLEQPDAFTRVWLPLASGLAGGSFDASEGQVRWSGHVRARDLRYDGSDVAATVEAIELEIQPLSLLPWRILEIEWVRAVGADVLVKPRTEQPAALADASDLLRLPRIADAELDDVTVRIPQRHSALEVGPGRISARDVGSARGLIEAAAPLQRSAPRRRPERARLELAVRFAPPAAPREGPPAYLIESLSASLSQQRKQLTALRLSGSFGRARRFALHGDIVSKNPEKLLWFVAGRSFDALDADSISGALALERAPGAALAVASELEVDGLRSTRAAGDLPAQLRIGARMQAEDGKLELDRVDLTPLADGNARGGRLRAEGHVDTGAGSGSEIEVVAHGVALAPWLRLIGLEVPEAQRLLSDGELTWSADGDESTLEGELRTAVAPADDLRQAGADPGATALLLRPKLRFGAPAVSGTVEVEGPGAETGTTGKARLEVSLHTEPAVPELRIDGHVASFDLTPLRALLAEDATRASADRARTRNSAGGGRGVLLRSGLRFDALRLRELVAESGSLHVDRAPDRLELRLEPTRIAGGRAWGAYTRLRGERAERIELELSARDVALPTLLAAFDLTEQRRIEGLLSLDTRLAGEAPSGADPLERADGRLRFQIQEGAAENTRVQQLLVEHTALEELLGIRFAHAGGDYPVEDGRVRIDELRLDGRLAHLVLTGTVGLHDVDLRVNPRVGPDLARRLPTRLARRLVGTVLGQFALPLVVTLRGPYQDLHYGVRPATPSLLAELYGGVTGFVRWVVPGGGEARPVPVAPPPSS